MSLAPRPALVLTEFANPPALHVEEQAPTPPGPGELLLAMSHAPINPADLNILEGKYGELPELPAAVGNEGVGEVVEVGPGVQDFAPGDLVLPMQRGTWKGWMTVPAEKAILLPPGLDPEQASMLTVNPPTAWQLLHSIVPLEPGNWVVQNAANSGVGRAVIQIAAALGWRTISIVRRPELVDELRALGGDAVLLEEDDLRVRVKELCGAAKPRLALNAVGGASALNLANALAPGGTLVTFGAMGRQPLKIPNGLLIFRDLRFTGFWLTRWMKAASTAQKQEMFAKLSAMVLRGELRQPVAAKFSLHDWEKALAAAGAERREGKVLFALRDNA
jgi:trans-2-enoyl-CoA reductase